jgi:hypothetical protein
MRRTGKLLYVPGLISLIGLLIMLPSFYKRNMPVKEYCITMFMPKDCNGDQDWTVYYSTCGIEKEIKRKKQIKFTLDNNEKDNKRKMEMIRYESLKLKYTTDTSTVVLVDLTDSITYGNFMSIVDICVEDGHKRYASWDNKFVIFGEWPEVKTQATDTIQLLRCGYMSFKKAAVRLSFLDQLSKTINKLYTPQGSYLLLGWIILFLNFLYFRKKKSVLQEY